MKHLLLGAALVCATAMLSQSKDPEVKLFLRDGSVMTGTAKLSNIVLVTDYGKLDIPLKSVSAIVVGITPNKTLADKITNLVKQLSNSAEEMRQNAHNELIGLPIGAIPVLSELIYSGKIEPGTNTDYTPEAALQELMTKHNVDDNYSSKDVVTIDYTYTMGGIFEFAKIDLKTEYGSQPLSIPKDKIREIEVMYIPGDGTDKVFTLQGSKHISSNTSGGWLKTGITLKQGQKFNLIASGEVSLQSLSGNKYKPDGSVNGATNNGEGYDEGNGTANSTYPIYGNVVYKIGDNGTMLKAGAKFSGSSTTAGMLFISIYETVFNAANTGSYTVKISLK